MLYYIQKMLPESRGYMAEIIYQITDSREVRESVTYNGEWDQFEIPISVLADKGISLHVINGNDRMIEGTSIHYHVDLEDNFCFRIE